MQDNPKVTNIPINAKGGAFTLIAGTIMSSRVEVIEDPAFNAGVAQGLTGFYLDPTGSQTAPAQSPAVIQVWLPQTAGQRGQAFEPITFGGDGGRVNGWQGRYTGAAGTPLLQLTTNSATPGGVLLVEWP